MLMNHYKIRIDYQIIFELFKFACSGSYNMSLIVDTAFWRLRCFKNIIKLY